MVDSMVVGVLVGYFRLTGIVDRTRVWVYLC